MISLIIVWKYFVLLPENISYYCCKNISSAWDFNDQSSMKCAKSTRRCWELEAIKVKYNKKNVQFWTQLEKNRWIKKSQCAKWQSPISDRKREFFSINLLTVIVLREEWGAWTWSRDHTSGSFSLHPGGPGEQTTESGAESFLHHPPDTLAPAFFWHSCHQGLWDWRRWTRQKPSLDTFPLDELRRWKY